MCYRRQQSYGRVSTPTKDLESGSDCSSEPETSYQTSQMAAAAPTGVPVFNLSFPPTIQLPKLDGTNWQQWSATLGALVQMNGMRRHLTHAAPAHADPANPDADVVACWDKEEEVIIGLLFLFVTTEVYSQIASDHIFPTVHAKYQQLKTLYGAVGSMATFNLWVSLANTKLQEGSPFLPQLQHMLDTRNTLGENGMAISDMQMSFILLDALPPSYSTIAGTILAAGPPSALSPQDLIIGSSMRNHASPVREQP